MANLNEQAKELILNQKSQLSDVYSGYTYFAENDVLLAKITPCFENGKLGIARNLKNGIGFGSSEFFVFRTKGRIIPEYLFYFLSNEQFRTDGKKQMTGAVGHKRVPKEFIENYKLPFPTSLDEQKRIVKILDEAFAAIERAKANAEKNLQNSRELFDSYLNKVFANPGEDWEEKDLVDVCDKIFAGGDVPKNNFSKTKTTRFNVPIFSNGIKNKGLYGYTDLEKVTKPSITISARGTIGYAEKREENFYPVIRLIVLTPKQDLLCLSFLHYALSNIGFSNSGTSIPQLTVPMVKKYIILVPPIPEQKKIVKKLDEISSESKKLETIYQQKLADLDELKKSILQKAFEGELTIENG